MKIKLSHLRKIISEAVRSTLLEVSLSNEEKSLLLKIDNTPAHFMPADDLSPKEDIMAMDLVKRKFLNRVKKDRFGPERYALTTYGSLETGLKDAMRMR